MNKHKIPFLDLHAAYSELRDDINNSIKQSLESGFYIGGEQVEKFEREFADYTESGYCVSVGNGLDAIHLGLLALGVGPGDEVIVPSHTFIATWLAVTQVGATIVPVEPDEQTFTIDPTRIEAAITQKTKAIIPVHLYGQSADLDPILAIAKKHGLFVLEDAAQAHGAKYKCRRIGSHGDLVAWSFYPGKNLGAFGDGGAITTNNKSLAETVRKLGNYGSSIKYQHELSGFNSRLDPIQASILQVKLTHLDKWNLRRKEIANAYSHALEGSDISIPKVAQWADPVWHLYVIRSKNRDLLQQRLADSGIQTLIHYPTPPHLQNTYKNWRWNRGEFPIAEKLASEILSIPIGPHLEMQDVQKVINVIVKS